MQGGTVACGFRFVWTDLDLPGGDGVQVFDSHADVTVLCHRPSFRDDPDQWVDDLERHLGPEVAARTRAILLRQAV